MVVWLGEEGVDAETSERMRLAGVDEIVVRRGSVNLGGRAPVLRFNTMPPVEGAIPVGIALEVQAVRDDLDRSVAEAVWRAISAELNGSVPAEIILDLPRLTDSVGEFVADLTEASGVSVVPLLSFDQLQDANGVRVVETARVCVVPAYGTDGADLRGIGERDPLPLRKKFEPLVASGARVRLAVVLTPRTEPPIEVPGQDLNPLTAVASMSTSSTLDRTFTFERNARWSGRDWKEGEKVAVRWVDAARLDAALAEMHRLVLPEVAGWDLVALPPEERSLGLGRESLLRYLEGQGPGPDVDIKVERDGQIIRVTLTNPGFFSTAVTNHGNWVQLSVGQGWIRGRDRGGFDGLRLGNARGADWSEADSDAYNAVRLTETYVGPGEKVSSGWVRVPSSRSTVDVRWNLTLSDGSTVTGQSSR
jgi:hypothetical protein